MIWEMVGSFHFTIRINQNLFSDSCYRILATCVQGRCDLKEFDDYSNANDIKGMRQL